jgi:hypothetical protein
MVRGGCDVEVNTIAMPIAMRAASQRMLQAFPVDLIVLVSTCQKRGFSSLARNDWKVSRADMQGGVVIIIHDAKVMTTFATGRPNACSVDRRCEWRVTNARFWFRDRIFRADFADHRMTRGKE